jgi:uncharacterized membrane protein YccC
VVLLINVISADSLGIVVDKLVATLIGGAIALVAYGLWPTRSRRNAQQALARMAAAQREYLDAVLAPMSGSAEHPSDERVSSLARRARLAASNAGDAVAQSMAEPAGRCADPAEAMGVLEGLRRVVRSGHVLRAELSEATDRSVELSNPSGAVELARGVDQAMSTIATALADGGRVAALPPLRQIHHRLLAQRHLDARDEALAQLDELIDAIGTVAHLLRPDPATPVPTG